MQLIKRALRSLLNHNSKHQPAYKEYAIGSHRLTLPADHALDRYQQKFKRYDIALGDIAQAVNKKYPNYTAIDIGANIGDSAALICSHQNTPVLCIEGNKNFLELLHKNAARLGSHITIEPSFVGTDGTSITANNLQEKNGTAFITQDQNKATTTDTTSMPMKSLTTILANHPYFAQSKLIKIDTDGYDFFIINNSLSIFETMQPILFFEYIPSMSQDGDQESIKAIQGLMSKGYKNYLVYDNFGNYLMSLNTIEGFIDLNAYLRSNKKYGQSIYYFDVCAFHEIDTDLWKEIRNNELLV